MVTDKLKILLKRKDGKFQRYSVSSKNFRSKYYLQDPKFKLKGLFNKIPKLPKKPDLPKFAGVLIWWESNGQQSGETKLMIVPVPDAKSKKDFIEKAERIARQSATRAGHDIRVQGVATPTSDLPGISYKYDTHFRRI